MSDLLRLAMRRRGGATYASKLKSIFGASLIGYWEQGEASGTTAIDSSGNGLNGTYNANVVLAQAGIGDGNTSALYNGTAVCNIYSAGYAAAFNRNEGTICLWFYITAAALTDGQLRVAYESKTTDSANGLHIAKNTTNNQLQIAYIGNNVPRTYQCTIADSGWHHAMMTWSRTTNQFCTYVDGVGDVSNPQTCPQWTAADLNTTLCCIGAYDTSPIGVLAWKGGIQHAAIGNVALSAANALTLATV